jgi:hypothetical protein
MPETHAAASGVMVVADQLSLDQIFFLRGHSDTYVVILQAAPTTDLTGQREKVSNLLVVAQVEHILD